jgi:cholesterol transport system auxiliary component
MAGTLSPTAMSSRPQRLRPAWPLPALLACALLAGCGGGERTRDLFFSLQADVAPTPSAQPIPGTLRVTPIAARGFVAGSRIVYRTAEAPLEAQRYAELLWEEVPARAIANDLATALRAAGVFEHVITAGDPARADYLLTGELQRFEHRPTDNPPVVLAELWLTLVRGRGREVLVARSYTDTLPVAVGPGDRMTPQAIADAFNHLSGHIIGQVIADAHGLGRKLR